MMGDPHLSDHGDALRRIESYLDQGEGFQRFATATLVEQAPAGRLLDGVLFVTTDRIIFWSNGQDRPDFTVDRDHFLGVMVDEQVYAADFRMVVIRTGADEPITFITERPMAEDLARQDPRHDPIEVQGEEFVDSADGGGADQHPEGFRQSGPEGSSASQSGTASRVTLSLPPVRHSIPVVPITAHWSRTLSPAAFHRHQVAITRFVDHAASHPMERLREEMDAYIDDLARTIRARMMGSAIAPCPDAGVHAALQFGAAVAISEREHGWVDTRTTHPIVHAALFLIQRGLIDDFGLGAPVPLEASFRCARSGGIVEDVLQA